MAYKFFGLLLISFNLSSNYSGDPGEIFAVKLNQDETSSSHLIIEKDGDRYAMIALPYDKQGQFIKFNDRTILINDKDFGESRISIKNTSMVDLSPEDSLRALEESKIIAENYNNDSILVLCGNNWHPGVIGIVASRIVEQYNKPAIIIAKNGDNSKGSGRSISGIDIGRLITMAKQSGILVNGGGHPMACGLTIDKDKINDLRLFLNKTNTRQDDKTKKTYFVDMALSVSGAIPELIKQLKLIEPFGAGNPEPKFIIKNVNLYNPKIVGENHIKCSISDSTNHRLDAIAFRSVGTELGKSLLNNYHAHVIGRLKISEWNGRESLQMHIEDVIEL